MTAKNKISLSHKIDLSPATKIFVVDDYQKILKVMPLRLKLKAYQMLRAVDESWTITGIQMQCGICKGTGKAKGGKVDCKFCGGVGHGHISSTTSSLPKIR